jgi:hypothetical protein
MKETAEDLFKRLGFDYNELHKKYGGTSAWYDMMKEIGQVVGDGDMIIKTPHYLTIQNYSKLLGKYIITDGEYQITQIEELPRTYDIEGLFNSEIINVHIEREWNEEWKGYLITFESGTITDRKYVTKTAFASPSEFTSQIESFIFNNLISLPF